MQMLWQAARQDRLVTTSGKRFRSLHGALEALGLAMRRHRTGILAVQWAVVLFYLVLLIIPAVRPLPPDEAGILNSLTRFAQFIFWGVWWPFVMLSTMILGRVWCGVFCPEGALTEWISRYGLGRGVPRWMKWGGWPFLAFLCTTVYGQLVSVYEYPKAAALVLGGSSFAAVAVGLLYGRGKRVWCRHLCPASGVFALLTKLAPVHYHVAQRVWDTAPRGVRTSREHAVNCAPLIDIRRMQTASPCHMCGRCAGERNAVRLSLRSPNAEVGALTHHVFRWEIALLVCGLLGIALGASQWSASPWFVAIKQHLGTWLVDRAWMSPLTSDVPWWLLTHYPEKNEVFTWLDGALIIAYIAATATLASTWIALWLFTAATLARVSAWRLAYALLPFAGVSVFLGLSALTVTLLRAEGLALDWVGWARGGLLALGLVWSAGLAWGMVREHRPLARLAAVGGVAVGAGGITWLWIEMFYFW